MFHHPLQFFESSKVCQSIDMQLNLYHLMTHAAISTARTIPLLETELLVATQAGLGVHLLAAVTARVRPVGRKVLGLQVSSCVAFVPHAAGAEVAEPSFVLTSHVDGEQVFNALVLLFIHLDQGLHHGEGGVYD